MTDKQFIDANVVTFFNKKKEYRCLSNFWEGKVVVQGREYASGDTRLAAPA